MEMIKDLHRKSSTESPSHLSASNWYDATGDETIADAILDKLAQTWYIIEFKGESSIKKR